MSGCFISVEGIEGVGKSTNVGYIYQCLQEAGIEVMQTREPGGTELGEAIREILLAPHFKNISHDTELLLMFAARSQHIKTKIIPALSQNQWVLCDRFTDASYAYQGGGRAIDYKRIEVLEQWVQGTLRPDVTLLLDAPVELAMQRVHRRGDYDRFEMEEDIFFENVRKSYLAMAKRFSDRYRVIDASLDLEHVQSQIKKEIDLTIEAYRA
ncbi:MAG: dTMP kinase [Gammaproteobacteria bacterium]|nr:dTMP kinase [Gammaproteobacteria bacterium]